MNEIAIHEPWTLERLEKLIRDHIEEDQHLDYKGAGSLSRDEKAKVQITKDVSAFANSDGRTVIYGVRESSHSDKKHQPEKIDPADGRDYPREWLGQIINQISPKIEGLKIFPVRIGPEEWQTCYVVEVPQSSTAHQATDFRYYRRYNFESVPMSDYEIRDVMNRRKHPNLDFKIHVDPYSTGGKLRIGARIENRGPVIARQVMVEILVPPKIQNTQFVPDPSLVEIRNGMSFLIIHLQSGNDKPVFPHCTTILSLEFKPNPLLPVKPPFANYITARLFADEMPFITRTIPLEAVCKNWV